MDGGVGRGRTVAERLRVARRRRFVGRGEELRTVAAALAVPEPPFAVLFVHGLGGVGKSGLLEQIAEVARVAGARVVRVDGRAIAPTPEAFTVVLPDGGGERLVLLVDDYGLLRPLDGWIREELVPGLPADALVVLADRRPPETAWRDDPGWRELMRSVRLDNLAPEEVGELLALEGVPEHRHAELAALTRGHPLALALLTERLRDDVTAVVELAPGSDVLDRLVRCFLSDVPDEQQRQALRVCALARFTTESLLRDVLGEAGPFDWLCGLAFVEVGPQGLHPHDLVRDVVMADWRWRDPDGFARTRRKVRAHIEERLAASGSDDEVRSLVTDHSFLLRDDEILRVYWDWTRLGEVYVDRVRPTDRPAIQAMTRQYEGAAAAERVGRWLDHPAATAVALRTAGTDDLTGFVVDVRLDRVPPAERQSDPGLSAAWRLVEGDGAVTFVLAFVDREHHQRMSPSRNMGVAHRGQVMLATPGLRFDITACYVDPDEMGPLLTLAGYRRGPDFMVGETTYTMFVLDLGGRTPFEWLVEVGSAPSRELLPDEFARAVRSGLRDLHGADLLAANPLAGLVDGALGDVLRGAVRRLAANPREEHLFRVLDRTYLRPAPTQAKAAALLGMPFGTYRRHLRRGVARVAELLWDDLAR